MKLCDVCGATGRLLAVEYDTEMPDPGFGYIHEKCLNKSVFPIFRILKK